MSHSATGRLATTAETVTASRLPHRPSAPRAAAVATVAPTNTLGVSMSIFFRYPSLRKCSDKATGSRARSSTYCGRDEPSGRHDRAEPRDRKQSKACE